MQVHENEEDQAVSLSKESKRMLLLLSTRDTNNNKRQENAKISNRHYHIQDIKYVQHKNINMTWDYHKFPRHPVAAEKFKMRGRNTIISPYHYKVYPLLGKGVCKFFGFHVRVQSIFLNLINKGYQLLPHHLNQGIPTLKIVTITKYLNITMIGSP